MDKRELTPIESVQYGYCLCTSFPNCQPMSFVIPVDWEGVMSMRVIPIDEKEEMEENEKKWEKNQYKESYEYVMENMCKITKDSKEDFAAIVEYHLMQLYRS